MLNKKILLISSITTILATFFLFFGDKLDSSWPRLFLVLTFYFVFVLIRITRWWNIIFDLIILSLLIVTSLFYKEFSRDLFSKIFIALVATSGAYFLTTIIAVQMGYPIIKEKYDTNK